MKIEGISGLRFRASRELPSTGASALGFRAPEYAQYLGVTRHFSGYLGGLGRSMTTPTDLTLHLGSWLVPPSPKQSTLCLLPS